MQLHILVYVGWIFFESLSNFTDSGTNGINLDDTQLFFPLFFLFVSLLCGFLLCLCPRWSADSDCIVQPLPCSTNNRVAIISYSISLSLYIVALRNLRKVLSTTKLPPKIQFSSKFCVKYVNINVLSQLNVTISLKCRYEKCCLFIYCCGFSFLLLFWVKIC